MVVCGVSPSRSTPNEPPSGWLAATSQASVRAVSTRDSSSELTPASINIWRPEMTYRTIDANDWIARQAKTIQEAGEARGEELIREVTLREVRDAVKRTHVEVAAAMG